MNDEGTWSENCLNPDSGINVDTAISVNKPQVSSLQNQVSAKTVEDSEACSGR